METDESREGRHFLEYWRVLRSRKEMVIAVGLTIAVAGWLITISLPKEYEASTRISVRNLKSDVGAFEHQESDQWYNPFYLKTQLEVIESQLVLDKVITNLNLQARFAKARNLSTPLTVSETRRELAGCMRVRPSMDTTIIRITVRRSFPVEDVRRDVMAIANEIADVYSAVSMEKGKERGQRGVNALQDELAKLDRNVEEEEKALEELRKRLNITVMSRVRAGGDGGVLEKMRIQQLEDNRLKAMNMMNDKMVRMEKIADLDVDGLLYTLSYLTGDPSLGNLRRELTGAKLKLKDLQETCGDRHPDVIRQRAVMEEIDREIQEALRGAKTALQADYEIAKKNFETIEKELANERMLDIEGSADRYLPFFKAQDSLEELRKLRDTLKMRVIEEKTVLDLPQTPVQVLDYAEMPDEGDFVSPNMLVNVALAILLGLTCGVGLAFFVEYMDTSVKNIEDIEKNVGVPVLGVIPQKVKSLVDMGDAGDASPYAEAYRVLRTNMTFSKKLGKGKALCVTSGGVGEGKSFTISNLSYVCASLGDRVLLVDSDLRRPRQHKIFGVSAKPGLAEVLQGTATLEESIRETPMPNLHFLPSGKSTVASAGLLDTTVMRALIETLKSRYDYIHFDAPPIIGVSDASILVSRVDAVLLVIQHRSYPRDVSLRARKMIENVGGNLLGVVLNNINVSKDYYSYYYHYYPSKYGYGRPAQDPDAPERESPAATASGQARSGRGAS